jgi:DNA-binding transcriptional LysR family regulator
MSGFTLRQLEIFAQVVEHGSFRRCADHLGVSQVSISEHVRELESRLGVKLFDRNAGGPATLTREGERAYRRVSSILADLKDLSWEAGGGREGGRRRLGVAMHVYVMRYVGEALAEFKGLHPESDVAVDFEPATPERLCERVQNRELDIAYFLAFDGRDAPPSELVRLEPLAIFVAHNHPLARREIVTVAELRATPAIHLTARNPLRIAVDRALDHVGASGGPIGLETDEYGFVLTSVHRGEGFVCMFQAAASEVSQSGGLVQLHVDVAIPPLQIRQVTRHSARHDPLASELIGHLGRALKTS